jgi:hypothetical protein
VLLVEDEGARARQTVSSWVDQSDWRKGMDQELEPDVWPFSKSGPFIVC